MFSLTGRLEVARSDELGAVYGYDFHPVALLPIVCLDIKKS